MGDDGEVETLGCARDGGVRGGESEDESDETDERRRWCSNAFPLMGMGADWASGRLLDAILLRSVDRERVGGSASRIR